MIRVWGKILRPIVEAAGVKRIVEIGAEYGTSTRVLLNFVRQQGGHLHCIDPVPGFDAGQFQRDNADVLTFYQDLSLNVLSDIHPVDLALVDGDHNWYTVYHELTLIEEAHGSDPLAQPLLFCHDIGWPYGRRDLYYDPDTIPEQFRQPWARKGILPRQEELVAEGGMNLELCNALREGGKRNGVLTGVEDYLAGTKLNFRFINLPIYYGLGILVTEERLAANPALRAQIEKLEQALQGEWLIALGEHLRCTEGVILQVTHRRMQAAEERVAELEAQLAATGEE